MTKATYHYEVRGSFYEVFQTCAVKGTRPAIDFNGNIVACSGNDPVDAECRAVDFIYRKLAT